MQLLKKWRANNVRTPVIIITARDGIDDRVQGLDIGADDYVVKPFDLTELLARIRAVTRRTASSNDVVTLSNGVLSLDPISHEVLVKDENGSFTNQPLTSREYALLEALWIKSEWSGNEVTGRLFIKGNHPRSNWKGDHKNNEGILQYFAEGLGFRRNGSIDPMGRTCDYIESSQLLLNKIKAVMAEKGFTVE